MDINKIKRNWIRDNGTGWEKAHKSYISKASRISGLQIWLLGWGSGMVQFTEDYKSC